MNEPPQLQKTPSPSPFPKIAAIAGVLLPVAACCGYGFLILVYLQSHGHASLLMMGFVSLLVIGLVVLGLGFGVVALVSSRRDQPGSIRALAAVGIGLNGLILAGLCFVVFLLPKFLTRNLPTTAQGRLDLAEKTLTNAPNTETRFYALDGAAKESFNSGKIDDARNFATELLQLAPQFKGNWNYGNAIQDGNLVLGRIAVRDGHINEANQYLLAAGASPGSPQMNSFGPNMSLAKDLLAKGQTNTVLQYFSLCRSFWSMDYGKLSQWSNDVASGRSPDFGANLVY